MSLRMSARRAEVSRSGAMYAIVPKSVPSAVSPASFARRAQPRSISVAWPSGETMMFAGFTSACSQPAASSAASASADWRTIHSASGRSGRLSVASERGQRRALEPRHDEVVGRLVHMGGKNRHQVRVRDGAAHAGLATQQLDGCRFVVPARLEQLDRIRGPLFVWRVDGTGLVHGAEGTLGSGANQNPRSDSIGDGSMSGDDLFGPMRALGRPTLARGERGCFAIGGALAVRTGSAAGLETSCHTEEAGVDSARKGGYLQHRQVAAAKLSRSREIGECESV